MQALELTATDAVSIASLINSTANTKDHFGNALVMTEIRIKVSNGNVLALATDRFTLAQYATTGTGPDGEFSINSDLAKFITANVKRINKHNTPAPVEFTFDMDTNEISARHGQAVYGTTWTAGKFPAVESLLNEWQADTTPRPVVLRGEFLARLNKFIDAFTKVEYWTMELGANPNGNATRPGPIMARRGGFKVLIQPNLMQQD